MKIGQVALFGGRYKVKLQYHRLEPTKFVPVILQLRLYALYGCSKKLLVFMIPLFAAEVGVMVWMSVGTDLLNYSSSLTSSRFSLSQTLISTTGSFSEHISVTGYYHHDVEVCYSYTTVAYKYKWVPCLAFDAILAVLSLWTAVRHLRQHSTSSRLDKPQLIDILIQGNVIYFLGCAFSECSRRIGFNNRM